MFFQDFKQICQKYRFGKKSVGKVNPLNWLFYVAKVSVEDSPIFLRDKVEKLSGVDLFLKIHKYLIRIEILCKNSFCFFTLLIRIFPVQKVQFFKGKGQDRPILIFYSFVHCFIKFSE